MPHVVLDRPYEFVPPHHGTWWPGVIQFFELYRFYLSHKEGIVSRECRHVDRLTSSLRDGHGILLCPNHCRTADPIVMGWLARAARTHVFAMASWHLFNEGRFKAFAIHKMGGFSINREGVDRKSIDTAIDVVARAERPLILFPEGATSRTNDHLHALLDGVAFIARTAAKRRAKNVADGRVVVHPVGIKYLYEGDLGHVAQETLSDIERQLTWQPQDHLPLVARLTKVGSALLALKEIEHLGAPQSGSVSERITHLIEQLLVPLETEWLGAPQSGGTIPRVKAVHMRILPEMTQQQLSSTEKERRLRQLATLQLAQQLGFYPADYVASRPTVDRILETLERLEEDLTGRARIYGSIRAVIEVDPPITVSPERDRSAKVDPLMAELEARLQALVARLGLESPLYEDPALPPAAPTPAAAADSPA